MKLKKKPKMILFGIIAILVITLVAVVAVNLLSDKKPKVKEVKVLKSIESYGYDLKDNKNETYKKMFKELEDILRADEVKEEEYVKKIAEMFVYDFYSLEDKTAKTDVGGVDFVHPDALTNFLLNAEDTYYKYVESNLYGEREQELPMVDAITIENTTPTEYVYNKQKYTAYEVKLNWTYTDESYNSYQKSATLIFVKDDIKYYLVELQ